MDRTALLRRATEVRRQIFASLPWEIRVAIVFTQLAHDAGLTTSWGKLIGQLFLEAGVTGMPPTGDHYNPNSRNPAYTLPNGYMAKFMGDCYGLILKKYGIRATSLAQEAIQDYLAKLASKKIQLKAVPLATAESFVRHGIVLEAMTMARKELRDQARSESLEDTDEDSKSVSRDLEDPNALVELYQAMSRRKWDEMMKYLAHKIHPDIPNYIKYKMEGYSNDEIVGAPKKGIMDIGVDPHTGEVMLPHYKAEGHPMKSDPTYWGDKYWHKVPDAMAVFLNMKRNLSPTGQPNRPDVLLSV